MSARINGSRSSQRSARLRMFRVATCKRSIGILQLGGRVGIENENVEPTPSADSTAIVP